MLNIPQKYKSLKFIKPIQWVDVFDAWRKGEANQESWKKHWEGRGFASWEQWRTAYAKALKPANLKWFLYSIENPLVDMPFVYGTPTHGWVDKAYGGEKTMQLAQVIKLPIIIENEKVAAIKNNFPAETMLTGIVCENKIILIEGMHRACALAGWNKENKLESKITIALAVWNQEVPILGTGDPRHFESNG